MTWKPFDKRVQSKNTILVCNMNQGGVFGLIYWNEIHGMWMRIGGKPELFPQWTHYMEIDKPEVQS